MMKNNKSNGNAEALQLIEKIAVSENWESAIKRGVNLLVKNDISTSELAEKIIESTKKLGPYYVLMPNVALAHVEFGPYNKKVGISLVVYENPISFSQEERHNVNLLFTLSTTSADAHMNVISKFASLMSKPGITEAIMKSRDEVEIFDVIKELF